jgi:hypothetical protein
MELESGGNPTVAGDASLGEYGLLQVSTYTPAEVGLPAASRYDPETNVFLGSLRYQEEAARMQAHYPSLVVQGSKDQWLLARLATAIGTGGARGLIDRAIATGNVQRGHLYDAVRAKADAGGTVQAGSQSAEKVWYRVHFVDYNFMIGDKIEGGGFGPPQVITPPAKYPRYSFPASLLPFTGKPSSGLVLVAALAAAAFFLARATT